jgi:hypothetical protein
MEPNDLKYTPPDDEALEAWLRTHASLPTLPDNGFSHRVLTALPTPARSSRLSPRLLAILLGAVVGTGLAVFKLLTVAPVEFTVSPMAPEAINALAQLADPKLHMALGVTIITLACVFWRDLRRRVGL